MAKISELPDSQAAQVLLERYRAACAAYDGENDDHGRHPSQDVNRWARIAATGGAPGQAGDDVQPTESERGQAGAVPAQDGRYVVTDGVSMFEYANGRTVVGDAAILARARAIAPNRAKVRAVAAAIPGYDRLK